MEVHAEHGEGRMGYVSSLRIRTVSQTRHRDNNLAQRKKKQNNKTDQHSVLLFQISGFISDHKDLSSYLSNTTYSTFLYLSFCGSFVVQ